MRTLIVSSLVLGTALALLAQPVFTAPGGPTVLTFELTVDDGSLLAPDTVEITDAVRLLEHLFVRGAPPTLPYPAAGADPTGDGLDCQRS